MQDDRDMKNDRTTQAAIFVMYRRNSEIRAVTYLLRRLERLVKLLYAFVDYSLKKLALFRRLA